MSDKKVIESWISDLGNRHDIFPFQMDMIQDKILLIQISDEQKQQASFLDQRLLNSQTQGCWIPWQDLIKKVDLLPTSPSPHYLFHVGHCGSTLLSKLISYAENTQSLREPLPLRSIAQEMADQPEGRAFLSQQKIDNYYDTLAKLWTRGYNQTVIKATSVCTDLMKYTNSRTRTSKFVFLYNRPETHLITLLAGQNAVTDLRGFAQLRIQRLRQNTGLDIRLENLNLPKLALLSWLSETTSIVANSLHCNKRCLSIEFEEFLAAPRETLIRTLNHYEITTKPETIKAAINSPVMNTYSKAPEHKYNADTRRAILNETKLKFSSEIKQGLDWLSDLSKESPLIQLAVEQYGQK